jgi:DNA-binding CsgD family transcriptional regulator
MAHADPSRYRKYKRAERLNDDSVGTGFHFLIGDGRTLTNRRVSDIGAAGRRRNHAQFFVLDHDYHVTIGDEENGRHPQPELMQTVRQLTAGWTDNLSLQNEAIGLASPFLIVRVFPLEGEDGWSIGVLAEPYRRRPTLAERAEQLGLTPTEYELVRLLSAGLSDSDTAAVLDVPISQFLASIALICFKVGVSDVHALLAKLSGRRL